MSTYSTFQKLICIVLAVALAAWVPTFNAWADSTPLDRASQTQEVVDDTEEDASLGDTEGKEDGPSDEGSAAAEDESPENDSDITEVEEDDTSNADEADKVETVIDTDASATSKETEIAAGSKEKEASTSSDERSNAIELQSKEKEAEPDLAAEQKILPSGSTFILRCSASNTAVVDISGGSHKKGANVQAWVSNMTTAQRFIVSYDDKGFATFTNPASGLVLDVSGARASNGTNVQLWTSNKTKAQKWIIKKSTAGAITITSALKDGLMLDLSCGNTGNGSNIQVYKSNNSAAQKFYVVNPSPDVKSGNASLADGLYTIASRVNTKYVVDMPGASTQVGTQVGLYQTNGTFAQQYYLKRENSGFYTVRCAGSNLALSIVEGNVVSTTRIEQVGYNAKSVRQLWAIDKNSDGSFTFISAVSGLALDVPGANPGNGKPVQAYASNGSTAQHWTVKSALKSPSSMGLKKVSLKTGVYHIMFPTATSQILDISAGLNDNGANCQIYKNNSTSAQRFRIVSDGTSCTIYNNKSDKVLDVAGAGFQPGTNVQQYEPNGTRAQKWDTYQTSDGRYVFISQCNGLALDVSGGSSANCSNVQVYTPNNSNAQCFKLKAVADNKVLANRISSGDVSKIKTIGDSITEGYGSDGWIEPSRNEGKKIFFTPSHTWYEEPSFAQCYANMMRKYAQRQGIPFTNAGASKTSMGDFSQYGQNWIDGDGEDVLFVALGTNDTWHTAPLYFEEYAVNALKTASSRSKLLVVMSGPGMALGANCNALSVERVDSSLRSICEKNGYLHLSLLEALPYSPGHYTDEVHPNTTGHTIMWNAIQDNLCL